MIDYFDFQRRRLRSGQDKALEVLFRRCENREPFTAEILPTRYGKSDFMRIGAVQLHRHGVISAAFALSPNVILRDQLDDIEKWSECVDRYGLPRDIKRRKITHLETRYTANGEIFLSATIQLICRNVDHFAMWTESQLAVTGKPPLFFIDECHTSSDRNRWGDAAKRLADQGALIVLLTATAIRDDGAAIPGFELTTVNLEEGIRVRVTRGSTPELKRVTKYSGTWQETRLIAHHETTFEQAWQEKPSPLCNISRVPFDVFLSDIDLKPTADGDPPEEDMSDLRLSELPESKARIYLGRVCRSPVVIREGAKRLVEALRVWKRLDPKMGAIVFCDSDRADENGREANRYAKRIRDAIEAESGGDLFNVIIATSAECEEENDKAVALIKKFKGGIGDILIVKQMAGMGLDCPRLKVMLDLSPIRTVAAYIQRLMRIATPFNGIHNCTLITPADCLAKLCFEFTVESQGGASNFDVGDIIDSYEIETHSKRDNDVLSICGTSNADFEDNKRNVAEAALQDDVRSLLESFPELNMHLTEPEIAARAVRVIDKLRMGVKPLPDIETQIRTTKETINELAKEIAMERLGGAYEATAFNKVIPLVYREAYDAAGVPVGLNELSDLGLLHRVQTQLERILVREKGRRSA